MSSRQLAKAYADWRKGVLAMLDAPVTASNLRFLDSWHRWEGGHTNNGARWNWLNTTMDTPDVVGSINSVGVKAYRDKQAGINATAQTLLNGRYDDIVQGLQAGDPYGHDVSRGLQVWVSGRPDGNPSYAQRVLGTAVPKAAPAVGRGPKGNPGLAAVPGPPEPRLDLSVLEAAFADDPEFVRLLKGIESSAPKPKGKALGKTIGQQSFTPKGPGIHVPMNWTGTHVTDGLGWDTKTAEDIMGDPGTPVSLPEDVTVVYFHPHGAQGGGSMLVRTKSGREYWLGHIAEGAKPGTHVRAGRPLAVISADHPRPHVHVDRRG